MHALFRSLGLSLIAVAGLALGGCAHHAPQSPSQARYDPYYDNRSNVQYGQVLSIEQDFSGDRPGRSESSSGGGGALVGGVIGGVIGNQVGKGSGRAAATVIGAVGGAILGNEIERQNQAPQYSRNAPYPQNAQRERSIFHVLVRLENRSEDWFDFERVDGLRVGDRVRIENGRLERY
ncbi:hypothetical protein BH11PSE10_BH11PSE10_03000 [soil metagenome]